MDWAMTVMMIVMMALMFGGMAWGVVAGRRSRSRSHHARPERSDEHR